MLITAGGYAPPGSSHTLALERFRTALETSSPGAEVRITPNVLDLGVKAADLLDLVEAGELTLCYFSTSYLVERVPELALIDTPFRFADLGAAHAALDGPAGAFLSERTEGATGFRVLGYWDNGFRHLTNGLRTVRVPADCADLRVRVQPSPIHERMIELWGAVPVPTDLQEGIEMIANGAVDAQENPLSNTVAYGIDAFHGHVSLTGHVYGARGVYAHAPTVDAWPDGIRTAVTAAIRDAIGWQREAAAADERSIADRLRTQGSEVVELTASERAAFAQAVEPLRGEIDRSLPDDLLSAPR